MDAFSGDLLMAGWLGLAMAAVVLVIAGLNNKLVVYFDLADMGISALALLAPLVLVMLASFHPFATPVWSKAWTIGLETTGWALGAYFLALNMKSAIYHNRSVPVGVMVGLLKMAYLVFSFVVVYSQLRDSDEPRRTRSQTLMSLALIAGVVFLGRALINGERVYHARGWPLPPPKGHFWSFS